MEKIKLQNIEVVVFVDNEPLNPRSEYENVGTMVCFHRRYSLGDEQQTCSPTEYMFGLMRDREWNTKKKDVPDNISLTHLKAYIKKHFYLIPLYLYDHSGLTISTKPFFCRWDSGCVGFIYAGKDCSEYDDMIAGLQSEVETYDKYLRGEVYCYDIKDAEGEVIDSCCGFYGFDDCKKEALHTAQQYI